MKKKLNRKIAIMLAFVLVLTNFGLTGYAPVQAAEDTAEEIVSENKNETDEPSENEEKPQEKASENENMEEESAEGVSEDGAADEEIPDETVSESEVSEDLIPEEPAGDLNLHETSGPLYWRVTPGNAVEKWYVDDEGNYYVDINKDAFIGYYPNSHETGASAVNVTVRKAAGAGDVDIIVGGKDYAWGTSVNVAGSISNAYVAHGSIVEKDNGYIHVGGLTEEGTDEDEGDYLEDDPNTVHYQSGWKVYKETDLSDQGLSINYRNTSINIYANGKDETLYVYTADDKQKIGELQKYSLWGYGGYGIDTRVARTMRGIAKTASTNFVISSDKALTWVRINKTPDTPNLAGLELEIKDINTINDVLNFYIYNKSTGLVYTSQDLLFSLSSDYTINEYSMWKDAQYGLSFSATELGARGCYYQLYAERKTEKDTFTSEEVKVDGFERVYIGLRTPEKKDISEINMYPGRISLTQADYDIGYYSDQRGTSVLKFIIAASDAAPQTVSEANVSNWKGRKRGYWDERGMYVEPGAILDFDKMINSSGAAVDLETNKDVDVYAAWFLPAGNYDS
ncbi:MAG: hypothetical protein K6F86_02630, partial [Lachnospiraceae bacterium]|nr:hypothetical protein [Lachnospiraceae bacterium]